MTNKITSKVALDCAMTAVLNMTTNFRVAGTDVEFTPEQVKDKLMAMYEQMNKKNDSPKGMTENQKQNEDFKVDILSLLADGKSRTATEILNGVSSFEGTSMTNQRVSALLRQLRLDGKIDRETIKGKTYFKALKAP